MAARAASLLVLLTACTDPSSSGSPDLASSVPLVDVALAEACAGGKPPGNGVQPGDDLHKLTLAAHPNALCNDGSPAILYIRKASVAAATNRWVIHQQAGGACSSYDVCADRWCGRGAYEADKMSSTFAPAIASASGVFARNGANDFGPANQVYLYYCSSDSWTGRRSDIVFTDPAGSGPSFRVHFRGHDILEAAATVLLAGATSDDGVEVLPALGAATQVLFSGSSAGSNGMTTSLDWWAKKVPSAQSFGMLDSVYMPLPEDIDDPTIAQQWRAGLAVAWTAVRGELYNGFADESCLDHHPGDDAYLCGLTSHVQLNHLTTPFFTRQDLTNPVTFGVMQPLGLTMAQYAQWTRLGLERVASVKANAEEAAAITRAPGSHASNCGQHIVMLNSPWFGVAAGPNATVDGVTVHDALASWGLGATVHALDTHPSGKSVCVQTTGDQ